MSDADAQRLAGLNRCFIQALLALGEAGHADTACRLAASGWSLLRHGQPREAERLNGVLHALSKTTHPAASAASNPGETPHGSET